MRLAIFGAGGMGRELADIANRCWDGPIIIVSDSPATEPGFAVVSPRDLAETDSIIFAVGSGAARKQLSFRFPSLTPATIISGSAIVSTTATISAGTMICDYVLVNHSAVVGRHVQLNCFSQISHDCIIGDFVTFAPRVSCNGWVEIEDGVTVGAGAIIRNGRSERRLHIGRGATIGMGAVVLEDVAANTVVVGNPARARAPKSLTQPRGR